MPTPNTNSVGVGLHEFRQSRPCDKILCGAMAARLTSNQKVTGSSPVMETTFAVFSQDILMIKVLPLFCEDWNINFSIFLSRLYNLLLFLLWLNCLVYCSSVGL